MGVRMKLHEKRIERLAGEPVVLKKLGPMADKVEQNVRARTRGSSTIRPFGEKMSQEDTKRGVRVGTSWGPAVPVEYGTSDTPAQRVLLGAAEKVGRVSFK